SKIGTGTQSFTGTNSNTGVTTVSGGAINLVGSNTWNTLLQISGASAANADVQRGRLVFDYTTIASANPATQVQTALHDSYTSSAFASGTIHSSTADTNHGLGWLDDGSKVTVAYTYYGDANLDGVVDTVDFNNLAA